MRHFGWTRLAYLLSVLAVLMIFVRMDVPGAETRSLATEPGTSGGDREAPAFRQWSDEALSSLEDMRSDFGGTSPDAAYPDPPAPAAVEGRVEGEGRESLAGAAGTREPAPVSADPPVFYRPPVPGITPGNDPGPVCGDLGGLPEDNRIVFPLRREYLYSYEDTWGAPRTQGGHEGTDLMTPSGVPEYAVTDGTVVPVAGSDADGWNTLGGHTVMVRADYSIGPVKRGDLFYYAHLERESELPIGSRVRAGQVVGYAGDTGQGPPGTKGLFPPHLHLGWYDGGDPGGRSAADSGAMNPYPLLEWIKSNGGAVTGGSDARYCEALEPRPPIPSANQNNPAGPDLATGSDDPRPSPVLKEKARKDAGGKAKGNRPRQRSERPERPDRGRPEAREPQETPRPTAGPPRPARPDGNPKGPNRPDPEPVKPNKPKPPPSRPPVTDQDPPQDEATSGAPTPTPGTVPPPPGEAGGTPDPETENPAGDETGGEESDPTIDQYGDPIEGEVGQSVPAPSPKAAPSRNGAR